MAGAGRIKKAAPWGRLFFGARFAALFGEAASWLQPQCHVYAWCKEVPVRLTSALHLPVLLALAMAGMLAGAPVSAQASAQARHAAVRLIAEDVALVPGRPMTFALHMVPQPGWHT
ncbi:MAG: hypothetical protein D6782_00870, partial [Alphaproteobacteria bacterium]